MTRAGSATVGTGTAIVMDAPPPQEDPRPFIQVGKWLARHGLRAPHIYAERPERGLVLTGGGALLRDLDRLISDETGLHVQVADDPLTCVARGGGRALELVDMHGNEFFAPE